MQATLSIGERYALSMTALLGNRKISSGYSSGREPFADKNIHSALVIGKAQAIAILAAGKHHIPCFEYTPAQVKQGATNYGASSKEQVQQMVKLQLNLPEIPEPNDAPMRWR
jgi:crossover junction endodeoxyribonuclease RuvC